MTRYTADRDCPTCAGTGYVYQSHAPGYVEQLVCDCIWEQIPEDDDGDFEVMPAAVYAPYEADDGAFDLEPASDDERELAAMTEIDIELFLERVSARNL